MARVIKDISNRPRPLGAQSVKIQGGVKEGFKIHLNGPSGQDSKASIQGPKGHNYVITPAGAAVGENISINGGGLYIRAKNNKKQLITATSCPDNQVKVQVGQGKSAVQLSIQVAPQGKRGEVELNCVRNEVENGGTGYTVSVNREVAEDGKNICSNKPIANNSAPSEGSPICRSPQAQTVTKCQAPWSHDNEPRACDNLAHDYQAQAPQDQKFNGDCNNTKKESCIDRDYCYKQQVRLAEKESPIEQEQYKYRDIYAETERMALPNAEKLRFADREYIPNWLYKRKLDLHHHKPTISYLIGRRMTALFKEMRKTTELHPPAPPFVKF